VVLVEIKKKNYLLARYCLAEDVPRYFKMFQGWF